MTTYKVEIKDAFGFPAPQRVRSGVTVLKDGGYMGELSAEQLEAIKADDYLVVEEAGGSAKAAAGGPKQDPTAQRETKDVPVKAVDTANRTSRAK